MRKWAGRGLLPKWCAIQLAYCRHMDSYTDHCKRTMGSEGAAVAIRRHRDQVMANARSGVILSRTIVREDKEPISAVLATQVRSLVKSCKFPVSKLITQVTSHN